VTIRRWDRLASLAADVSAFATVLERPDIAAAVQRDLTAPSRGVNVCFVGRINSGKSTLINTLIGEVALPVGPTACTSSVIRVANAASSSVVVRREDDRHRDVTIDQLTMYASRTRNPGNVHGVTSIDVFAHVPWLATGATLVDTPGFDAADENRLSLIGECVGDADVVVFTYACPAALPGPVEMRFLSDVARRRAAVLVVQNEFEDSAELNGEGHREHIIRSARRHAAVSDGMIYRINARSGRGSDSFRSALSEYFDRSDADRLFQTAASGLNDLLAGLTQERAAMRSSRDDDGSAIAEIERQYAALRVASVQGRSLLTMRRAELARRLRGHGDLLHDQFNQIISTELGDVEQAEKRVNRMLADWMSATLALERDFRLGLGSTVAELFAATGLELPTMFRVVRHDPIAWRFEAPQALGVVQRAILGEAAHLDRSRLLASVLAGDARRLVLAIQREFAALVSQVTEPLESWLALAVDPLVSRLENHVRMLRGEGVVAEHSRRQDGDELERRVHRLRDIQRGLRELRDAE
jgi:hypothetical protein